MWVLLWKDLLIDLRRVEHLLAMLFFALLTLLIFNFAVGEQGGTHFRYSARSAQRLAAEGLPAARLAALAPLKGVTFTTQEAFLQAVDGQGAALTSPQRILVLQASRRSFMQIVAGGLFWITFLLAGVLGLDRSFGQEREHGAMDGLLLTPVPRGVLYLGKMASNVVFLLVISLLVLPLLALLYGVELSGAWAPLAVIALGGIVGFSALGTLLGGVTASLRGKEVLLPLLLFPLLVPLLLVVVQLTDLVLQGEPLWDHRAWLQLLLAFDMVFLIASYLTFDFVLEA